MAYEITTADIWVGDVEDRVDALPHMLETLYRAGADLDFAIVRPASDLSSDTSILFVAPLVGEEQIRAAAEIGLGKSGTLHALRITGPDRPGLTAGITRCLADANIRVSGLWAACIEDRSVFYLRLESAADAKRAAQILSPHLA
jgi:hypothetical protein